MQKIDKYPKNALISIYKKESEVIIIMSAMRIEIVTEYRMMASVCLF